MRYLIYILITCWSLPITAQLVFENQTMVYNPNLDLRSGNAGSCVDLDNDGLDDLIIIDKATHMFIGYNQGANKAMRWVEGPKVSSTREYLCIVTDLENDGIKEIITSGSFSNTKVYKQQPDGNYLFDQQIKEPILAQGGNTIDIDNDGYLDYFLCSDESKNLTALNDGNGVLRKDTLLIDWTTTPQSDNSGNYASEWVDVNGDGLVDLAIAKCKIGVYETTDPRRINRLMIQQTDGTFVDEASERGFAVGYQSWTTSMADFDNDGDFDCLVTNHDHEHQLLINDGNGYFFEKPFAATFVSNFAFQSIVRDFDNNGYLDVYLTGDQKSLMLMNTGGAWFDVIENPLGEYSSSAVVGDINNDGFCDIIGFFPVNINFPGLKSDQIFINKTETENNYIKIKLKGNESNVLGIGSEVSVYSALGIQKQVVKSGESYGICNPFTLHFGLADLTHIDSITVNWTSGQGSVLKPYELNKTYLIEEGKCNGSDVKLYGELLYCDDSIQLNAIPGMNKYLWSNGDTTSSILINNIGVYQVAMTNDSGCINRSFPIKVVSGRFNLPFIISDRHNACLGDTISLSSNIDIDYLWSTTDTTKTLKVTEKGLYFLELSDMCGDEVIDSVYIDFIDAEIIAIENDTVIKHQNATLLAQGENIIWYESGISDAPVSYGETLLVTNLLETTSFFAENRINGSQQTIISGVSKDSMNLFLHSEDKEYSLFLTVFNPVNITGVTLNTEVPGFRKLVVLSDALEVIDSEEIYVEKGINTYSIDLHIPPGSLYYLGTDVDKNLEEFGTVSPQLNSNTLNISYPYVYGEYMDIVSSTGSRSLYPYFYDLTVEIERFECVSERVEVEAFLDIDSNVENQIINLSEFYPNPVENILNIAFEDMRAREINIFSLEGKLIHSSFGSSKKKKIDVSNCTSGIYFVFVKSNEIIEIHRFIKR